MTSLIPHYNYNTHNGMTLKWSKMLSQLTACQTNTNWRPKTFIAGVQLQCQSVRYLRTIILTTKLEMQKLNPNTNFLKSVVQI